MVTVRGNTYPVKDQLRALGGVWKPEQKVWMVPDDKAEAARQLVLAEARKPRACIVCGAREEYDRRGYPVVKIYGSGECRDCYEERKMGY